MRLLLALGASLLVAVAGSDARGHGVPIKIGQSAGKITASDGLALTGGYADTAFDRTGGTGDDGFNDGLFTTAPGFEWTTFPTTTPLTMEVLGRPDFSSAAKPMRWLWHWDLATHAVDVATATSNMDVLAIFATGSAEFSQFTLPTDVTVPVVPEPGEHDLLLYQLTDSAPRDGVYGFFARLTAPGFVASDPFLVAFAYQAGVTEFAQGIKSINAAAGLAGDFNVDGVVEGADFLAWQRTLGATGTAGTYPAADGSLSGTVDAADLAIWRGEFGRTVQYPPQIATASGTSAPEPGAGLLASISILAAMRRRTSSSCDAQGASRN